MKSNRPVALPRPAFFLLVATLFFLVAPASQARVSAVGTLDFSKKNFKVGDWVRYRVDLSNDRGYEDMTYQEVRIVGEDTYRGEKCFWLETWHGRDSKKASYDLTLVSYDAFKDPDWDVRYKLYVRLVMFGSDDQGIPEMLELRRSGVNPDPDMTPLRGKRDTLDAESVPTAKGLLDARLVQLHRKIQNSRQTADSTVNRISDVVRRTWVTRKVPLTSTVKEEEVNKSLIHSYAVGQPSTSAPEILIATGFRTVTVVDWGTGATSELLTTWRKNGGFMRPSREGAGMGTEAPTDMPR